jgi:hypothetical protein
MPMQQHCLYDATLGKSFVTCPTGASAVTTDNKLVEVLALVERLPIGFGSAHCGEPIVAVDRSTSCIGVHSKGVRFH